MVAAGMAHPFFVQSVALVVAAAVIAYLSYRLGLVPIVGFLLAGVIIGPNALGLVSDPELVNAAAELGVILLLFTIGLEFSLERLARIVALVFGGGGLQVALTSVGTMAVLLSFGVDWRVGLFTGFLVSLSSTAIVLKLLADRGETSSTFGQVCVALLIFQDLAIIVMVLLVPMLAGTGGGATQIGVALAKALGIILAVLLVARRAMPWLIERVARTCSPELFLLTVVAICLGTAWLTSVAGVSLSVGAFLAGLLVSETRFSHHAFGEVMPLQILFSAIFFASVGMLLDVWFLVGHAGIVLGAVVLVLLVKGITTAASVRALGYPTPVAVASGLTLAQVGEFSFVLNRAGQAAGLSPAGLGEAGSQAFIAATVILMIATPQLTALATSLAARLERRRQHAIPEAEELSPELFAHLSNHVIIAGYGQAARQLVHVLQGSGIPFVITTLSPIGANEAESEGLPVLRGDAARRHTLVAAGIERAKMLVVADDDPPTARRIVAVARSLAPTARILVRTRYRSDIRMLEEAGADLVVADELESVVQLFAEIMRTYRIPPEEIERHEAALRGRGYAALLEDEEEPAVVCDIDDECLTTRPIEVREGTPLAGRTLAEADFERRFGLVVRAVARGAVALPVEPQLQLAPRDRLTLGGSADAFAAAASLFRRDAGASPGEVAVTRRSRVEIDPHQTVTFMPSEGTCGHVSQVRPVHPSAPGCEECLQMGDAWVHLRICMVCGHVGCCDSSKNRHATKHFHATSHPIVRSLERGEQWGWCYADEVML